METGDFIVAGRKEPLCNAFSTRQTGRLEESHSAGRPRNPSSPSRCCQKTPKTEENQPLTPFLLRLARARFVVCIGALAQAIIFGGLRVVDEPEIRLYSHDCFGSERNFYEA